jgi:hypothetical protein
MTDKQPTAGEKTLIDTTGWSPAGTNRWRNSRGGDLQIVTSRVNSIDVPSLDSFRDLARSEILSRGGGLISAELSTQGVGVAIAKFPQKPSGMTYEGQLVVVRDHSESRVIVRFPETGMTGLRDAAIFDSHVASLPDDVDPTEGWMSDPYDKTRRDPLMRNGADDERFDAKFPDHPLTLVRAEASAWNARSRRASVAAEWRLRDPEAEEPATFFVDDNATAVLRPIDDS